jgi:hypothetical protein
VDCSAEASLEIEERVLQSSGSCPVAAIHPVAAKVNSRKPISSLADPYALGPGLRGVSAIDCRIRADILLHVWIDIHSKTVDLLL